MFNPIKLIAGESLSKRKGNKNLSIYRILTFQLKDPLAPLPGQHVEIMFVDSNMQVICRSYTITSFGGTFVQSDASKSIDPQFNTLSPEILHFSEQDVEQARPLNEVANDRRKSGPLGNLALPILRQRGLQKTHLLDSNINELQLIIKSLPYGRMSKHLEGLQVGQSVRIRGPIGRPIVNIHSTHGLFS